MQNIYGLIECKTNEIIPIFINFDIYTMFRIDSGRKQSKHMLAILHKISIYSANFCLKSFSNSVGQCDQLEVEGLNFFSSSYFKKFVFNNY